MATFTITATPQPDTTPPSILVEVNQTDTPAVSSVTLRRVDPDGRTRLVRTPDGQTLTLSSNHGSIVDSEPWYGQTVTYKVAEGNAPSVDSTVDADDVWLTHIGVPSRSMPITLRIGSLADESWDIEQAVYPALLRENPIIITGGARQSPASTLIVTIESDADRARLKALLADGSPLLLNVPPALGMGVDTDYIQVGKVSVARPTGIGGDPLRAITLPYQVVDRPGGGTRAVITWANIAAQDSKWSDIPAGTTWAQLVNP